MSQQPTVIIVKDYPKRRKISAFVSVIYFLLLSAILGIPFILTLKGSAYFISSVLIAIIAEIIVIYLILRYNGQLDHWRDTLAYHKPKKKRYIFFGIAFGISMFFLLQFIGFIAEHLGLSVADSDTSTSLNNLPGISKIVIVGLFLPIIVPFVEETFFRGLIIGSFLESDMKESRKIPWAVGYSSFAFSLVHFQGLSTFNDILILVWVASIGVVNAIVRIRTNSVFVTYAIHASYNACIAIVSLFGLFS